MSTVVTRSGALLNLAAPDPGSIIRADIASGLSGACRFAAQTEVFYSVAQHTVMVADLVEDFLAEDGDGDAPIAAILLAALHHDSHEAFMSDLPAPLKQILPEYDRIALGLDIAIFEAIGLSSRVREDDIRALIDRADMVARCIEAEEVIPMAAEVVLANAGGVSEVDLERGRTVWRTPLVPAEARELFSAQEDRYHAALQREASELGPSVDPTDLMALLNVVAVPLPWLSGEAH